MSIKKITLFIFTTLLLMNAFFLILFITQVRNGLEQWLVLPRSHDVMSQKTLLQNAWKEKYEEEDGEREQPVSDSRKIAISHEQDKPTRQVKSVPLSTVIKQVTRRKHAWQSYNRMTSKPVRPFNSVVKRLTSEIKIILEYCGLSSCLPAADLHADDIKRHDDCLIETVQYVTQQKSLNNNNKNLVDCTCHLQPGKPKHGRVGLVSLPGSGNTWVRGLLERATNICTASMWCDPNLRATYFCGEGLHSAKALVIKNHDPVIRWRGEILLKRPDLSENNKPEFDAVIFVHRNPYDAMVAERNREVGFARWDSAIRGNRTTKSLGHHVEYFGPEYFGENLKWNNRVRQLARTWEQMVNHLLIENKNHPVLVVKYEDLKANTVHEVMRMVQFLGYEIPKDLLVERMKQKFTAFYRNHTLTFQHFTTAQKNYINSIINRVDSKLKSQSLPLRHYIAS